MMRWKTLAAGLLPALLAACASVPPAPTLGVQAPAGWQAPLPHAGSTDQLANWWEQQGDPLLPELIRASQAASPDLASARARIAAARAERTAAGAALAPNVDLGLSSTRSRGQNGAPHATASQAGLSAAWEIDILGGGRAARDASEARLAASEAQWHLARVSLAAETANAYEDLRTCWQLLRVARSDANSRAETARLTELSGQAGLQAPANVAMARASAADGAARARAQQALCDSGLQALSALTALPAASLRARFDGAGLLAGAPRQDDQGLGRITLASLPATTLAQRPDIYIAERNVAAASADFQGAVAAQYPRLSLQGSVGVTRLRAGATDVSGDTWSIGPLALTLPVFDGGRRHANEAAARAAYEAAVSAFQASVRTAVSEVEQALLQLDSTASRAKDARIAYEGYRIAFEATNARYQQGMASLFELEEARRAQLAAETGLLSLQRERSAAWISLYRAAGGGWSRQPQ